LSPLSGNSSDVGIGIQEGAEIAVALANERDALDGIEIKLVSVDDKGTPEGGVLAYQQLRAQGISLITGTANSSIAVPVGEKADDEPDVLYMTAGAQTQEPLDNQSGNRIFANNLSPAMYADAYLSWIS